MKSGSGIAVSIAGIVVVGWYVVECYQSRDVERVCAAQVAVTEMSAGEVVAADRAVGAELARPVLIVPLSIPEAIAAKLAIVVELIDKRLVVMQDQVITNTGKSGAGAGTVIERLTLTKDQVITTNDKTVAATLSQPDKQVTTKSNPTPGAWIVSKPGARDQKRKRQKQKARSKRLGRRAGAVVALAKMPFDPDMKEPDNVNREPKKVTGKFLGGFKEESWPLQCLLYCAVICSTYIVAPKAELVQEKRPVECTKEVVPPPAKLNVTEESEAKKLCELKPVVKAATTVDVAMPPAGNAPESEGSTKSLAVNAGFSPSPSDMSGSKRDTVVDVASAVDGVEQIRRKMKFRSPAEVFIQLQKDGKSSLMRSLYLNNIFHDSVYLLPSKDIILIKDIKEFVKQAVSEAINTIEYLSNETGLPALLDYKNGIVLLVENNEKVTFITNTSVSYIDAPTLLKIQNNLLAAHKQYLETGKIPSDLGIEILTPAANLAQEKRPVECTKTPVPPPAKLNVTEENAEKKLCELKEVVKGGATADVAMPPAGTPEAEKTTKSPGSDYNPGPGDMSDGIRDDRSTTTSTTAEMSQRARVEKHRRCFSEVAQNWKMPEFRHSAERR